MIKFFRHIRRRLLTENKFSKYLIYAIGEIVLVVIGILIALQINNKNELNKLKAKEQNYLINIKADLHQNTTELNKYISIRERRILSANKVLEYFEGKPLIDLVDYNNHNINVQTWHRFHQQNNTFDELINSGNLALISNDSIKKGLQDLQSLYNLMKSEEDHFYFDSQQLLFNPFFRIANTNPMVKNYTYQITNGAAGNNIEIPKEDIERLIKDVQHKNGFVMAVYEFNVMNTQFEEMKKKIFRNYKFNQ